MASALLTKAQAAAALSVSLRSLERYARSGEIRTVRVPGVGRRLEVRVPRSEIARFRRAQERRAG